jgi:hypothetical protein
VVAMASNGAGTLRRHEKVVAAVDLPGVPAGTPGKVFLVSGISWIRYRVRFANGAEIGTLDRSVLATRDEWAERERAERRTRRSDAPA